MMKKVAIILLLLLAAFLPRPEQVTDLQVASKKFTESVILGEMLQQLCTDSGAVTNHLRELGGSRLVFDALLNGEIDAYPEYTGTLIRELLAGKVASPEQLRETLAESGIEMSEPLGFNNTYAIGMVRARADQLQIARVSELARHPNLKLAFSNEFMEREDGWPGLMAEYGLEGLKATGLDHDVAYRQLRLSQVDAIDVYTTDARIDALDIKVLEDDRNYFPRYDAVILYRNDLKNRFPDAVAALERLAGSLSEPQMVALNSKVEISGQLEAVTAADFLDKLFGIKSVVTEAGSVERITQRTLEHLELVRRSLLPAILVGIPIGVVASKRRWFGQLLLGAIGVIQTIPALALLVMLMPFAAALGLESVGAGSGTAIIALFLYSLLPIVRNTHSGLSSIDPGLIESAEVLNLPRWYRLIEIEMPLASRSILAGVKTAAVINVGFATLGALVGAGGYGQPVLSGIRLNDYGLILQGAVPAAVMALTVQGMFELSELVLVPRGLRLKPVE